MKRKTFSLEDIRIASPCPTSWENMLGDDRVRFCDICSKNVYNISAMTRSEAQELIRSKQGRLCGMIYTRKDGTVMTSDCPVGLAAIRKRIVKRIAGIAAVIAGIVTGGATLVSNFTGEQTLGVMVPATPPARTEPAEHTMGTIAIRPPAPEVKMGKIAIRNTQASEPAEQTEPLVTLGDVSE